jgi:hypothetical protein
MRFSRALENHRLVGDMQGLAARIEHQDADSQPPQR